MTRMVTVTDGIKIIMISQYWPSSGSDSDHDRHRHRHGDIPASRSSMKFPADHRRDSDSDSFSE